MMQNNQWHGGWVDFENGGISYINAQGEEDDDPEASGSGGGSGCGSGPSSSGLIAGSAQLYGSYNGHSKLVTISWGSGDFNSGPIPSISAMIGGQSVPADWSGEYTIRCTYNGWPELYIQVPDQYHC